MIDSNRTLFVKRYSATTEYIFDLDNPVIIILKEESIMKTIILFILQFLSGFVLFSRTLIRKSRQPLETDKKVSVIIPARNEEQNLPYLLDSLHRQTYKPYEIIVIDDFSEDKTEEIARRHHVQVIKNTELPPGWTGKTWAVWNGYQNSSGEILVFLDADVRLTPRALESLIQTRERVKGVISVVPYHHTEKFYERFSLITNILGVFAFTSPFEKRNPEKGLYGSCIVAARNDYEKINGHHSIKSELLDDLNLGKKFSRAGIPVENYIGWGLVSFRMYPAGIKSEIQGFGKGALLSTATLRPATVLIILFWLLGLFAVEFMTPLLLLTKPSQVAPFVIGYILYTIQIIYFVKYVGYFGRIMPVFHFLSSLFFLLVTLFSFYQVTFLGYVSWKGRHIKIGGGKIC